MSGHESKATRLGVTLLAWLPTVLSLAGVALAFSLVWGDGSIGWILFAIVATSLVGGTAVALEIVVEDRLAQRRSRRPSAGSGPIEGYRAVTMIGVSFAVMNLGLMLILPAGSALLVCGGFGGGSRGFGRCLELWTNRSAWWLFGFGVLAFVVFFAIPEEKEGMRRILRRRNDRARRQRKRNEAELAKSVHEDVSS
jgi:hypothetical protein